MAKADRLERLDIRREELEAEYFAALVSALRRCAAGSWGLFDHNQDRSTRANWASTVEELCDLGQAIDKMRNDLGLQIFELHREFEEARGPVSPNTPGEPKQAKAWLDRLGEAVDANGD